MTAKELTVRVAQQDDHSWIVAAHGDVYATEFGFDRRFQDNIADKMRAFLQWPSPFNRIWVGVIEDRPVASIAISERPGGVAFLNFVLVLPQHRGLGAGRAMLELALEHARAHSFAQVQLETYSCLVDARALYARLGFQMTEVTPGQKAYGKNFDQEFWSLQL
ncbi:Acetyltransferase (GNAT) family protein [Pseudomonas sp. NFIX28]|nr:GNAT family N-acetyltransferase [Pseudomonas sp. NFIX28]SDY28463.1 Acetyltransferase (GNAT) family protein [Pseudomonas sp. NFIX28]